MRARGLRDGCCCNDGMGLKLRMAAVAMDAQGIRAVILRLCQHAVSWKPWRATNPSLSSGRESSRNQRAYGNPMSSTLVLCITRSLVIRSTRGLLAFIMDTH